MIRVRHEEYASCTGALPFWLGLNLERTPYNCSQEHNWHENIELQSITYGNGTVLLDGKAYPVKPGDICLVNSNAIHYTYTDTLLRYNCLIIDTAWCRQMGIPYEALSFSPKIEDRQSKKGSLPWKKPMPKPKIPCTPPSAAKAYCPCSSHSSNNIPKQRR